jgi:hypothetical protein
LVKRALLLGLLLTFIFTVVGRVHASEAGALSETLFPAEQNIRSDMTWQNARDAGKVNQTAGIMTSNPQGSRFFKSLLLPGWGQYDAGNRYRAYTFFAIEAAMISSIFAMQTWKGWLEDDYESFALQHGGISGSKDHQFYVDMGNWQNNIDFNEQRLRDRQFDQLYTGPGNSWNWDDEENRLHFKSMRLAADRSGQRSMMFVGGLILNHLLSAVDASGKGGRSKTISMSSDHAGNVQVGMTFNTGLLR